VGFAEALTAWRPLVKLGGGLVVSECVWFGSLRPEPAAAFWREGYPAMDTAAAAIASAEQAGWRLVAAERLTAAAWMQSYYGPLAARMDRLAPCADPALAQAIAEARDEMDVFARFCDTYGYALLAFDTAL
jgi:serine/threonine-protein kinase HipA